MTFSGVCGVGFAARATPTVDQSVTFPILTPKPGPEPRLTGAKVFGVRRDHPILFTFTATGDRPITFSADGLPPGAVLDPTNGRLSGNVEQTGPHVLTVHARNAKGEASCSFTLVVGDASH